VKVTLTVQFAPAAKLEPQVVLIAKLEGFVPVKLMEVIGIGAVPVLVRVAVCGALVTLTLTTPKFIKVGVVFSVL